MNCPAPVAARFSSLALVLAFVACGGSPDETISPELSAPPAPGVASSSTAPSAPSSSDTNAGASSNGNTADGVGSVGSSSEGMAEIIAAPIAGAEGEAAAEGSGDVEVPSDTLDPSSLQPWQLKRSALLEIIGRPEVPLAATETARPDDAGLTVQDFSIATDANTRINGTSYAPKLEGRLPAVIFLHGTGGSRQEGVGLQRTLAQRGFLTLAIDARHHGAGVAANAYVNAIYQAYVTGEGHPFLYDTVWDVMRLIDYLEQRPDVDASRIGLVGSSKGGMETYLAAAIEPRIAAAVPWISVESFAWALDNNQWQARVGSIQGAFDQAAAHDGVAIDVGFVRQFYDRVVPGIAGQFDGPEMVAAIAPRALLAINGDSDPRTPMGGLELCEAAARAAYSDVPDHFELYVQPNTGHAVTAEAVTRTVDWLAKWLE